MANDDLGLETELRLGLPGGGAGADSDASGLVEMNEKKRMFSDISDHRSNESKDVNKSQVVGWPPVCSYRRKNSFKRDEGSKIYVKVSMDGAPFLRKINLGTHKNYWDLVLALENLYVCFGIGEALKDDDNSDYVLIYEDKDGDWMLAGDVPWKMFCESCKKLRIKKKADAKGIGLHAKDLLKRFSKGE
ncbi:auxin-induced AUX22 [Olea europaea subsp. europaea]|uniref:Auxin-responsive protein n=1 Tax=Olea europaea subsp. europaea TaxID=158383 RepID=A0A8S0PYV6_OLEEU|nr:auxin-induced AUX22 [Olea europaea subsp. europaea]